MNSLVRWTIGGSVSVAGFEVLRESIRRFGSLYPEIRRVICYNGLDPKDLLGLGAELFEADVAGIEYEPKKEMWKLYPPRLDIDCHELILDNDLIIIKRVGYIDDFFSGNNTVLLHGRARFYGKYDHLVPDDMLINGGLFGMPPGFDFADEIRRVCEGDSNRCWENRSDDQGVIAASLFIRDCFVIPNSVICNYDIYLDKTLPHEIMAGKLGVHFIGINRHRHLGWEYYKTLLVL